MTNSQPLFEDTPEEKEAWTNFESAMAEPLTVVDKIVAGREKEQGHLTLLSAGVATPEQVPSTIEPAVVSEPVPQAETTPVVEVAAPVAEQPQPEMLPAPVDTPEQPTA